MSQAIISAENLGKRYSIRHQTNQRYTALRDVLADKAKSLFRRNGSNHASVSSALPSREDFWALRNVSFEVRQGEVVGIIGRNGAGKSTLLKILSRITEPTEGKVTLRGRVASLLEVGTGFHPELTGRENIYLNGAILGMSRAEIKNKFDEIVAFAETEKFLDTPVKRYSSGMYVRLAFAVAAHLEPEILVVDEVLAVGDAEFQKKCLGKMDEVARQEGRTVLFVSHNMAAITSLTSTALLLDNGNVRQSGQSRQVLEFYNRMLTQPSASVAGSWGRGQHSAVQEVLLLSASGGETRLVEAGEPIEFEVHLWTDGSPRMSIELFLEDANRATIGMASLHQFHGKTLPGDAGSYKIRLSLQLPMLAAGVYYVAVATSVINSNWDHRVEEATSFEIPFSNPEGRSWDYRQSLGFGVCALPCIRISEFMPASARRRPAYAG